MSCGVDTVAAQSELYSSTLGWFHSPEDLCRSDLMEWGAVLVLVLIWHVLRVHFCSGGSDSALALFTSQVSTSEADTKLRNSAHNALGIYHCIGVLVLTTILIVQHWDETYDEWFGLRNPARLDALFTVQPWWPLAFSGAYFLSDMMYIFDFPVFLTHHIVSIVLIFACMVSVEMRFMGVLVLFAAEVGGIMLSIYYRFLTLEAYAMFCAGYGLSRVAFTYIAYKLWESNQKSLRFADDVCSYLVGVLVLINWHFWWTHTTKLVKKIQARRNGEKEHKTE